MDLSSQQIHDFTNNALRIEVINKLITEKLEKKEEIDREYLQDLKKFLQDHVHYLDQYFLSQ